ncbi:hypothetical protein RSAG8_13482, partial [Rhizoctonia solani AG-8 WAC10335]
MQVKSNLIGGKNGVKRGPAPTMKSLYGSRLDHPVIRPQLLDSTRLKDEPGGFEHSLILGVYNASSGPKTANLRLPLSFRDAARSGLPKVEAPSKEKVTYTVSSVVETHLQAGPRWRVVRHGKKGRSMYWESSSVTSSQSHQSSDRNFPLAQRPGKRNSLAITGNQQLPAGRRSVKKPPGPTALILPDNPPKIVPCTLREDFPINDVTNVKREFLEIWWQILGFTGQRGPMKQDKFVKALEAMGFTCRNKDGAQVSY